MGNLFSYAKPPESPDLKDCYFYHTIDLPEHGTLHGNWDLREKISDYLGFVDFKGKRVLDAGTGNGLLAFEAERRGAQEVIAFDLGQTEEWDHPPYPDEKLLPLYGCTLQELKAEKMNSLVRLNNAFWFCHKALQSKVKMLYGNIYKLPDEICHFDISIFGALLLHLKNPLSALEQAGRLTRKTIIVTDLYWENLPNDQPVCKLMPSMYEPLVLDTWWMLTPALVCQFLNIMGFTDTTINYHIQLRDDLNQTFKFFTVVGNRK